VSTDELLALLLALLGIGDGTTTDPPPDDDRTKGPIGG
jgi:hypothetical protein